MFGGRKRQPDARPNTAATLHPAPSSTGCCRLEESPSLPIDGLGEDLLLAAEPRRLSDYRGPIHGVVRGASRQFAPASLGVLHPRQGWGSWGGGTQERRTPNQALNGGQSLGPRAEERSWRNFRQGAKSHAPPPKGQAYLQINRSREPRDGAPDCCCHFAHHGVKF